VSLALVFSPAACLPPGNFLCPLPIPDLSQKLHHPIKPNTTTKLYFFFFFFFFLPGATQYENTSETPSATQKKTTPSTSHTISFEQIAHKFSFQANGAKLGTFSSMGTASGPF